MKAFLIRLAELLFVNCILSAIVTASLSSGLVPNVPILMILLIICADVIFLCLQFSRSRALCAEAQNLRVYFKVSLSSFGVFAAINLVLAAVLDQVVYTWLFITAKALSFATNYSVGNLLSAVLFQVLVLAVILLAPLHRTAIDEEDLPTIR